MSDDQIIGALRTALKGYNLGDIKYLLQGNKSIAGFILCSCLIDHVACFRYNKESSGKIYQSFIDDYLSGYGYDSKRIYIDLRCKLVHNYTVGRSSYDLTSGTQLHLKKWNIGSVVLDLNVFVDHLEKALDKYLGELESDSIVKENAINRYRKVGILQYQPIT